MVKKIKSPKIKIGRPLQITVPTAQSNKQKIRIQYDQVRPIRPIFSKSTALMQAEETIFLTSNAVRTDYGKVPLTHDDRLQELACYYSQLMLENNFFSHVTPDGKTLSNRFVDFRIRYHAIAENIAFYEGNFQNIPSREVVESWLQSPGHRANLLDEKGIGFTHLGIGIAMGKARLASGQVYYYTQLFWLP